MERKTAFIGHKHVLFCDKIAERLRKEIEQCVAEGCLHFLMGTHGEFDRMALNACRSARERHPNLRIEVVLSSYRPLGKKIHPDSVPYRDVDTLLFPTEELHFKKQITESNKQMMDECDTLICYVDPTQRRSGAKTAMNYAKRKGLRILNLFREEDRPTFGMTADETATYWKNYFSEIIRKD